METKNMLLANRLKIIGLNAYTYVRLQSVVANSKAT